MLKNAIVVADDRIPFLQGVLEPYCKEVRYLPGSKTTAADVRDAEILITRTRTECNAELLEGSAVKLILTATIGFDHIDTAYAAQKQITWYNAPGCNAASVRQYIASALLNLAHRRGMTLRGMTIGVVGVGHVGSKVAQLCRDWGMNVLQVDPPRARKEGMEGFVSLEEAARKSDFLTFHVPLEKGGQDPTWHLADETLMRKMKPGAILINSSRGAVADNAALKKFLKSGALSGAVLDVWEGEPEIDRELLTLVDFGTPHIAGYSTDGKANGTSQCVNRIGEIYNIPALQQFYPADLPPRPAMPEIPAGLTEEEERRLRLNVCYDIAYDDALLREDPGQFEKLRGSYRMRREPEVLV